MSEAAPTPGSALRAWHVDTIAVLVVVVMIAAWYGFLVRPVLARRADALAAVAQLEARRESATRIRAERQDLEKRLDEARRAAAAQSVQLEPRSRVNQRLDRLTSLAQTCGVEVERLAPGATAESARHGTMALRLTGRAPYASCAQLVCQLHSLFNDTALTSLKLAAAPSSTDQPVTIELELLWFTAPDVRADAQKSR